LHQALLLPLLSGAAMVYASGVEEKVRLIIAKSVKVSLILLLPPLAFLTIFGSTVVLAWTGTQAPAFNIIIGLACLAAFCRALSLLALVIYRVTGGAMMDVARQTLRITIMLGLVSFASRLGLPRLLVGLVLAELVGMVVMWLAVAHVLRCFSFKLFLPDIGKIVMGTVAVLALALVALSTFAPSAGTERMTALVRLALVLGTCTVAAVPIVLFGRLLSVGEGKAVADIIMPWRVKP
jgi:hypothetical protein